MIHQWNRNLLIVDDDVDSLKLHEDLLAGQGYTVKACSSPQEALNIFQKEPINVALIDYELGTETGANLTEKLLRHNPAAQIIIFTAYSSPEKSAESQKVGVRDFISKPIENHELLIKIDNAFLYYDELLNRQLAESESERLKDHLIGEDKEFIAILNEIFELASTENTILLLGETGTGKEVVARAIHRRSRRCTKRYIPVNCPAIMDTVLESELFGHEKGAFTDAHQLKKGYFETADQGTIFLDEIGDLSNKMQASLLRVLENGEITRVGSSTPIHTDVRIIAATNKDLSKAVIEKKFRQDLFYRISIFAFHLPPLRKRIEDVVLLADFFVRTVTNHPLELAEESKEKLLHYSYPGNVRELRNIVLRAAQKAKGNLILPDHITFQSDLSTEDTSDIDDLYNQSWKDAKFDFEKRYFLYWHKRCKGNITEMSKNCQRDRSDLSKKLNALGISGT